MRGDTDELTIRRARKLLEDNAIYVNQIQMWDGNTWHITVVDTETEEESKLQSVTTRDALPFIEALTEYARHVVESGMHD